jgi:phosphoglycerate dehydrogenase-like enzyme
MIDIALPHHLARDYGSQILAAAPGAVRLVPMVGGAPDDPDASQVEIAVNGIFDGPVGFRELIETMPALRWIHTAASGIDDFVSPALRDRGVIVTNSAGLFSPAIAEYALAAIIGLARGLPDWQRLREAHVWGDPLTQEPEPFELHGRRLGIVGYGSIGRYLASVAKALGMEVWATKRVMMPTVGEPLDRLLPSSDLHELLRGCDVVVLAASLNSGSRRLIGAAELAAMRPHAILVNVGRGALLDEGALAEALHAGRLRGAALDVAIEEPLPSESPLWAAPNLTITPHIAGNTGAGWDRTMELFGANLRLYLDGHEAAMANVVDIALHL